MDATGGALIGIFAIFVITISCRYALIFFLGAYSNLETAATLLYKSELSGRLPSGFQIPDAFFLSEVRTIIAACRQRGMPEASMRDLVVISIETDAQTVSEILVRGTSHAPNAIKLVRRLEAHNIPLPADSTYVTNRDLFG